MSARGAGIRDYQIERRRLIDVADPGGHGRSVDHLDASLARGCACPPALGRNRREARQIPSAKRQVDPRLGIATGQGGTDPAARAGDQNRARGLWSKAGHDLGNGLATGAPSTKRHQRQPCCRGTKEASG
jgi:hypothetical protein